MNFLTLQIRVGKRNFFAATGGAGSIEKAGRAYFQAGGFVGKIGIVG